MPRTGGHSIFLNKPQCTSFEITINGCWKYTQWVKLFWWTDKEVTGCPLYQHLETATSCLFGEEARSAWPLTGLSTPLCFMNPRKILSVGFYQRENKLKVIIMYFVILTCFPCFYIIIMFKMKRNILIRHLCYFLIHSSLLILFEVQVDIVFFSVISSRQIMTKPVIYSRQSFLMHQRHATACCGQQILCEKRTLHKCGGS